MDPFQTYSLLTCGKCRCQTFVLFFSLSNTKSIVTAENDERTVHIHTFRKKLAIWTEIYSLNNKRECVHKGMYEKLFFVQF